MDFSSIKKEHVIKKTDTKYIIKNKKNLKIRKILCTVLNIYIKNNMDKNINTYFDFEKNFNIEIKNPKFINNIYDTNIYYEIITGYNIFEIDIIEKNDTKNTFNISLVNNKVIFPFIKESIKIKINKESGTLHKMLNNNSINIVIKIKNLHKKINKINVIKI